MTATSIRLVWHLAALAITAFIFLRLPFSPLVNAACALLFWIVDGALAEFVFRKTATRDEIVRDLRDRVDNPPS